MTTYLPSLSQQGVEPIATWHLGILPLIYLCRYHIVIKEIGEDDKILNLKAKMAFIESIVSIMLLFANDLVNE